MSKTTKEINMNATPKAGDSVYIGFITQDGKIQKGKAVTPFDKVQAIYSDTEVTKGGVTAYHVRVTSGDAVKVVMSGKGYWQAIA